jgi:hypothetical protein
MKLTENLLRQIVQEELARMLKESVANVNVSGTGAAPLAKGTPTGAPGTAPQKKAAGPTGKAVTPPTAPATPVTAPAQTPPVAPPQAQNVQQLTQHAAIQAQRITGLEGRLARIEQILTQYQR